MPTHLLALDFGTTHCKAGLLGVDGSLLRVASRQTPLNRSPSGEASYDPEEVWVVVASAIREVIEGTPPGEIAAIGVASMAETGLLVDRMNGEPHSALIPWFDPAATPQAQLLGRTADPVKRFCRTGIRPNFKCSLAKILWLRERDPNLLDGAVWLNAADYLAYRLAGTMATDYSLAGRTYAYDIGRKEWDRDWLSALGIAPGLFPRPCASGEPVGSVQRRPAAETGLVEGTPVAICGHDHICAAFAAGAIEPGMVFDSMGTAEALVGAFAERRLTEADYRSGLVYGCHVARGRRYWMGGLSASGGSVEWLRGILGDPALSYDQLQTLLEGASAGPTGILYFPYLSGSGSPHTDLHVRAAFIGLQADHDQAELVKAVLEGTAYEVEFIRRRAEEVFGIEIHRLVASGGGTRNPGWMQIKADVSGCAVQLTKTAEATLLGAALVAGVGIGIYADEGAALAKSTRPEIKTYYPDEHWHSMYLELYDEGYLALQRPLREK